MRVHVLIPAAGRGVRFGTADNKVFAPLAGQTVIAQTARAILSCRAVDTFTIIGRLDELDRLREALAGCVPNGRSVQYCEGGDTRQASVARGLRQLAADGAQPDDLVLVHDAARPLVSSDLVARCVAAAGEHGSAIAAYPVADTVKRVDRANARIEQTVPRERLWTAQTPQAASIQLLRDSFEAAERASFVGTDESSLLEAAGISPFIVQGERSNIKITTQDDLAFAEMVLRMRAAPDPRTPFRVGMGYDIHQLVPGRRLVLGGVEIAHTHGLLGHSDADVILHAICDALLGAAALPDIGHLFPNTDPRYAGADSIGLLRAVHSALEDAGYAVGNVDACVIAEEPKISPHASAMKRVIAEALHAGEDCVSIKATTNEKIGSLGAGEGIACHATALIIRTR